MLREWCTSIIRQYSIYEIKIYFACVRSPKELVNPQSLNNLKHLDNVTESSINGTLTKFLV